MAMDPPTMTRWITCLLWFLAVIGGGTVHAKKNRAAVETLGRIVYLPNVNFLNDHASAPFIFDAENMLDLAKTTDLSRTDMHSKWFENSDQLRQEIAAEMGIKESHREVRFSVESEFKRLAGPERDVNAAEVHAKRLHSKTYIPRGSNLNDFPLKDDFMKDFRRLPVYVKDAHDDRSWIPFRDFMNKWGSHIVDTAYTGAVYQSWSTAKSSNNYRQGQMEAKACMKAEGLKGRALEACNRYSESDREEASRLTTFDTKRVRGGTAETRRQLERDLVTSDLLEKFLREDHVDEQPVRYEYMPVWDFLLERSDRDSDDAKRALALQGYYEGWKATGCPLVVTTGQLNNNAQMMVPEYTKSKQPTGRYLCIRRCQGCHDYNNDCHFDASQACCRAYGPSALRPGAGDYVVRATDWNSGWCSNDNGCKYSVGSGCHCEKMNEEGGCNYEFPLNPNEASLKYKIIWKQQGSHSPRDDESFLAMAK
jgi:hypothetical protein